MRIDLDTYREIIDTLTRNKTRSLLTGFGVFWGVFMLIVLIGGGQGLKEMLEKNFEGFATNTTTIWAQKTTKAYKGMNKGRSWYMDLEDVDRLKRQVPELEVISPVMFVGSKKVVNGNKNYSAQIRGCKANLVHLSAPKIKYGRYLSDSDDMHKNKVCVIGKEVYDNLFPGGGNPCGASIRIDSTYYTVVGLDVREGMGANIGSRPDQTIDIPQSVLRIAYNRGNSVDLIVCSGKKGVVMSSITSRMRHVVARAHLVHPDDEQGVMIFNTEVLFGIMDSLFDGVNFLIWLVGIGRMLAGAIGVSNIMMVTVRERTAEIGIRRAIGATPKVILLQIITESIVLTTVAGMSGIMIGVAILQMIEMGNTVDGVVESHFQVSFSMAIGSLALLCLMGVAAGLAPAFRAMNIKPVDAMRDE